MLHGGIRRRARWPGLCFRNHHGGQYVFALCSSENINVAMGGLSQRHGFYRAGDGFYGNLLLSIYRTAAALPAA